MLCVQMISGKEVAKVPLCQELSVKALKQHLHRLHDLPPRFRQRLLLNGQCLEDADKIDSPMVLELMLLSYCEASVQAKEVLELAALRGSVAEVGLCKEN